MSAWPSDYRPYNIVDKIHHDVYPAIDPLGQLKGSCKGKNIVITGAGRGIGKAIAIAFALAEAKTLVLTARSSDELSSVKKEIQKDGRIKHKLKIITHNLDVTSKKSVEELFDMCEDDNIMPDVLVNNAGYMEKPMMMHEQDPDTWFKTWQVNVQGTYLPTHYLLKTYMESHKAILKGLTIINVSDVGSATSRIGFSSYNCAKTAVNRFTEYVDLEYRSSNVRCFAFHPGSVVTTLTTNMPQELHHRLQDTPQLAGGFAVYLSSSDPKIVDSLEKWRGRYLSCLWDVEELMKFTEKMDSTGGRWGENGWGMMRPNW